jgi:uncharacterized protein YdaU (DUF1376 family)
MRRTNMHISGVITIPFHIGDFLSGTLHMDTLEKGAYIMLLLSHYQSGEKGLPNDDKKLSRIAGVSPKVWDRIKPILSEKFTIKNDVWVSQKCVEVLRKVHEKSSKQRDKALKRHNSDDATAEPRQCQPKPKPKPYILSKDNIPHNPHENEFDKLWLSWKPYEMAKGNKKTALQKYKIIRKGLDYETIRDGVARYIDYCHATQCKTKHVTTWLNQNGWDDDYTISDSSNKKSSYLDSLANASRAVQNGMEADFDKW